MLIFLLAIKQKLADSGGNFRLDSPICREQCPEVTGFYIWKHRAY